MTEATARGVGGWMTGVMGLATLVACHSPTSFVPFGSEGQVEYVLAMQPISGGPWRLRVIAPEDGPSLVGVADQVVRLVGLSEPSGFERRRWLSRADFGQGSCAMASPAESWSLELDDEPTWKVSSLPEELKQILDSLAEPRCLRCPRFELEDFVVGELGRMNELDHAVILASGRILASSDARKLWLIDPDGPVRPVEGCDTQEQYGELRRRDDSGPVWLSRGSSIETLEIDEEQASCRSQAVLTSTGTIRYFDVSPAGSAFELIAITHIVPDRAIAFHFDGTVTTTMADFQRELMFDPNEPDAPEATKGGGVVFRAPGRAVLSTGYEDLLIYERGALQSLRVAPDTEIYALIPMAPLGMLIMTAELAGPVAAHALSDDNELSVVTPLVRHSRTAAPFRGGWITLVYGGSVFQYDGSELCPEPGLELDNNNYSSRILLDLGEERYFIDRARGRIAAQPQGGWIRPVAPTPPAASVF